MKFRGKFLSTRLSASRIILWVTVLPDNSYIIDTDIVQKGGVGFLQVECLKYSKLPGNQPEEGTPSCTACLGVISFI